MLPRFLLGIALCWVACGALISAPDEPAKAKLGKPPDLKLAEPKPDPKPGDEPVVLKSGGSAVSDRAQVKPDPRPGELTVADILAGLKIDESSLIYEDEPPGVLWALSGTIALPGNAAKANIRIELKDAIFSNKRKWDPKAVRAAKVAKVVIAPGGDGE